MRQNRPHAVVGLRPSDPEEKVACNGCNACCRKELVLLTSEDDARSYPEAITIDCENPLTGAPVCVVIPHKDDGTCIYLGENGCTIYAKRPKICRVFTCVGFVRRVLAEVPRVQRRRDLARGFLDREIWDAGWSRMKAHKHG